MLVTVLSTRVSKKLIGCVVIVETIIICGARL